MCKRKIFIITENFRNEKGGDSVENIRTVGAYRTHKKAKKRLNKLHSDALCEARQLFDDDELVVEQGEWGSRIYLDFEWDTYHIDYTIEETTLE